MTELLDDSLILGSLFPLRWDDDVVFKNCAKGEQRNKVPQTSLELLVRASLSEPHTSVAALHMCVCMLACLRPYTMSTYINFNITKVELGG